MRLVDYIAKFPEATRIVLVGPYYTTSNLQEPLVYVDAGAQFQIDTKGFSVGDNDSFSGQLQEQLPIEKDISDLAYVLRMIPDRIVEIELLGFLGGRKDHEFATILEVLNYMKKQEGRRQVVWDQGVIRCFQGTFELEHKGIFSVFSFNPDTSIELNGDIKYPISKSIEAFSSHGLSNEALGKFVITATKPILLYFV